MFERIRFAAHHFRLGFRCHMCIALGNEKNQTPSSAQPQLKAEGLSAENQIFTILRDEILTGRWEAGGSLPSLRDLAGRFGVSRVPAHRAIIKLEEAGLVKRVHGSGVHVLRNEAPGMERSLPLVQTLDVLHEPMKTLKTGPGEATHFVGAAEQEMLWHLTRSRAVRLRRIPVVDEKDILAVVSDLDPAETEVFVFASPERLPLKHLNALRSYVEKGGHVVHRATWMEIPEFDAVKLDFEQGQHQLTNHYLEEGRRRLIRCMHGSDAFFEMQKQAGHHEACREAGWSLEAIRCSEVPRPVTGTDREEECRACVQWLREEILPKDPEVIMAVNDPHAAILRLALVEVGVTDIEVAGYDAVWPEMDWGKFLTGVPKNLVGCVAAMPPPVSVDSGHWEMGEALSRLALQRAARKLPPGPQVRIIPQRLVLPTALS